MNNTRFGTLHYARTCLIRRGAIDFLSIRLPPGERYHHEASMSLEWSRRYYSISKFLPENSLVSLVGHRRPDIELYGLITAVCKDTEPSG